MLRAAGHTVGSAVAGNTNRKYTKSEWIKRYGSCKNTAKFGEVLRVRAVVKCDFPGRGMSGCQFLCSPVVQ